MIRLIKEKILMAWRKEKMTLFVANTRAKGFKNFLVFSNDSVIVTYLSTYFDPITEIFVSVKYQRNL